MIRFSKWKKNSRHCFLAALIALPVPSFAMPFFYDVYLGGSGALSNGALSDNNPRITYGGVTDQYPMTSNSSRSAALSLNSGFEVLDLDNGFSYSLGVGIYNATSYNYSGNVIESAGGTPPSTLYNYNVNVQSTRVMAEMQVNWLFENFAPYINAGVGPAWVMAKGYSEKNSPENQTYPPLTPFANNTNHNVAYQAGVGISYLFNAGKNHSRFQQERLSIGYRYASMGQVRTGIRDSTYPYSLNLGTFSTNDVYLMYTHYF